MSVNRFFIPNDEWNPEELVLQGAEAHHCAEVMRHRPGDRVVAFNGQGQEATVLLRKVEKYRVELDVQGIVRTPRLPARLVVAQAIPKGRHMDFILQKATELGAGEVIPLLSERTVVRLDEQERQRKHSKWQRVVVEACKQCGQNWLPVVRKPLTMQEFFAEGHLAADLCLLTSLEPGSRPLQDILREYEELQGHRPAGALVFIGPEGDFTPAEISEVMRHGCHALSLGPIVLRTETASIYSLSILAYELLRARP